MQKHASVTAEKANWRVIHLEFNNRKLPGNLDWLERDEMLPAT
jgi:hypothetical protein